MFQLSLICGLFFLISPLAHAQISLPSLFSEMRSVNPAVVSLRKTGHVQLSGQVDKIEKFQNVKQINGSPFEFEDESVIDLTNINFFRGGKAPGFTSEWYFDYTKGKKTTELTDASNQVSEYVTDTSSYYGSYAFGSGRGWGVELHYVGYASEYSYTAEINGAEQTNKFDQFITVMGVKPGVVLGSHSLALGLFAEFNQFKADSKGAPDSSGLLAAALGSGGQKGLIELGIEADPITAQKKDSVAKAKPPMPMRVSLIIERKFSTLTLGYKGMYFKGQFLDLDKIIQNQLVYRSTGSDVRLEHLFNFSFGGSKGFTFGGSASYSKYTTKEVSTVYSSSDKHDTEIKSMALGVRIGYVY